MSDEETDGQSISFEKNKSSFVNSVAGVENVNFRKERSNKRKEDILRTAIRIFKEKGYNDTTIEEIANELQYTKSSIYYYIPKKAYLLFQVHEMANNLLLNNAKPIASSLLPPEQKMRELICKHVEIMIDEMSLLTMALELEHELEEEYRQTIFEMRNEYEAFFMNALQEGVDQGVFRNTNLSLAKLLILGSLNWIPHWYSKSGAFSKGKLADFFADYLISPLLID